MERTLSCFLSSKTQKFLLPACIIPIALLFRLEGLRGDGGVPLTRGRIERIGDGFMLSRYLSRNVTRLDFLLKRIMVNYEGL